MNGDPGFFFPFWKCLFLYATVPFGGSYSIPSVKSAPRSPGDTFLSIHIVLVLFIRSLLLSLLPVFFSSPFPGKATTYGDFACCLFLARFVPALASPSLDSHLNERRTISWYPSTPGSQVFPLVRPRPGTHTHLHLFSPHTHPPFQPPPPHKPHTFHNPATTFFFNVSFLFTLLL